MNTISNTTCTKCQHCGEWTNYAEDQHHKAREDEIARLREALGRIVTEASDDLPGGTTPTRIQMLAHLVAAIATTALAMRG